VSGECRCGVPAWWRKQGHRAARFKIGGHVLFEESDVRAWIKAHGIPAGRRKDADRGTGW